MKYDIFSNKFTMGAGNVPLKKYYSTSEPVTGLQAATKKYTDDRFNNIPATAFTTGRSSSRILPEARGDGAFTAYNDPAIKVFKLVNSGVVAGSYPFLSVDSKGRAVYGRALNKNDLPPIPYSKLINKPTTLAGWGITDMLKTTGGVMTGYLNITGDQDNDANIVNKRTVDEYFESSGGVPVGELVYTAAQNMDSHNGLYLRANGAILSKVDYSALYAVIGDAYGDKPYSPGTGDPWRNNPTASGLRPSVPSTWYTGYIDLSDLELKVYSQGNWVWLMNSIFYTDIVVTDNKLILFVGDLDGGGAAAGCLTSITFDIGGDGSIAQQIPTITKLEDKMFHYLPSNLVNKNKLYMVGGHGLDYKNADPLDPYSLYASCTVFDIDENGNIVPDTGKRIWLGDIYINGLAYFKDGRFWIFGAEQMIEDYTTGTAKLRGWLLSDEDEATEATVSSEVNCPINSALIRRGNYIYSIGGEDTEEEAHSWAGEATNSERIEIYCKVFRFDISDPTNPVREFLGYLPTNNGNPEYTSADTITDSYMDRTKKVALIGDNLYVFGASGRYLHCYSAVFTGDTLGPFTHTEATMDYAMFYDNSQGEPDMKSVKTFATTAGLFVIGDFYDPQDDSGRPFSLPYAYMPFTGGLNDYSDFYDGTLVDPSYTPPAWMTDSFRLPDVRGHENSYYINTGRVN